MSKQYKKLIKDGADAYMRKLFEIGWLDEWCDEEVELLHRSLRDTHQKNPKLMVHCLGEYTLEPAGVCTPEAYRDALNGMLSSFGVVFEPDYIEAAPEEGDKIILSVKTPKSVAHWKFKQADDWMHDDFIDFVNDEVMPALGEKRLFHPLPPASASVELVFHYPGVIESAISEGIIPDDDFFMKG